MSRPNVLMLTWHDAGRWFGCYGVETVQTPHVDQLAADGCRFTRMYSACAICSPSRAAIATGRYGQSNGVMFLTNSVNNNRLHRDEMHIARRLKVEHGYRTALFGVQHECAHEHVSRIMNVDERYATDPWPEAGRVADAVVDWLGRQADQPTPFYAQIGFHEAHLGSFYNNSPKEHYPFARDESRGLYRPPWLADTPRMREALATLQGYMQRGDEALGRILDALARHGLADETLVVMNVDHGVGLPRAKTTCYDPGMHVGQLLRWPGVIPAGSTVDTLAHHTDVLPTLLELIDAPIPDSVQGHSFAGHARGERQDERRDFVVCHMVENTRAIRTDRHKLIRHFRPAGGTGHGTAEDLVPEARRDPQRPTHLELYDLTEDPHEFHNLADDPAAAPMLRELDGRLWDFLLDHDDFIVNEPVGSDWQAETRRQLLAHCAKTGRTAPTIDGA
jgi:arylsulfatase A-like enzyme